MHNGLIEYKYYLYLFCKYNSNLDDKWITNEKSTQQFWASEYVNRRMCLTSSCTYSGKIIQTAGSLDVVTYKQRVKHGQFDSETERGAARRSAPSCRQTWLLELCGTTSCFRVNTWFRILDPKLTAILLTSVTNVYVNKCDTSQQRVSNHLPSLVLN